MFNHMSSPIKFKNIANHHKLFNAPQKLPAKTTPKILTESTTWSTTGHMSYDRL